MALVGGGSAEEERGSDTAVLELASIGCSIPLADLYAGVFALPGDDVDGAPAGREG